MGSSSHLWSWLWFPQSPQAVPPLSGGCRLGICPGATHHVSPPAGHSWLTAGRREHPGPAAGAQGWKGREHPASWERGRWAGRQEALWDTVRSPAQGSLLGAPRVHGLDPLGAAGLGRGPVRRARRCPAAAPAGSAWASRSCCLALLVPASAALRALGWAVRGYLPARETQVRPWLAQHPGEGPGRRTEF